MSKRIYIIAGEASGDFIGAQLIQALKKQNAKIQIFGIGGHLMQDEGLESLFPMQELSIMGIIEVVPKIPLMIKRINQTVLDIEKNKADIVITIDAPDFSFRVQKKLHERNNIDPKQIHYVAPTVWAWKPKRAKKIAEFLDAILCLFDFEPPYFEKEGLKAIAVGHPMIETGVIQTTAKKIGQENTKKIGIFFGSRQSEIKKLSPLLLQSIERIISYYNNIELIIPTLPHLRQQIENITKNINIPIHIFDNQKDKWPVFKTCDCAIAVSGTVGLELAVANVPHVIAYKMNIFTFAIIKRVVQTKYAHLANIILQKEVVPEFIQDNCTPENISDAIGGLLNSDQNRQLQLNEFDKIREKIGHNKHNKKQQKPSDIAADFILSL